MIVSHQHRFIFMKTRKTAGTSVEIALSRHCGPDDVITPIKAEDEALRAEVGGRGPQNYESTLTRRSAYNHMSARRVRRLVGRRTWDSYFKFTIERNPWDAVVSNYYWRYRHLDPLPPLERFVNSDRMELFARRNAAAYRLDGKVAVDRVCRYESLQRELEEVWARLGLAGPVELPHAKGNTRRDRRPYRELYSEAAADRVRVVFEDAIAEFGYEF